jgi:hypothetical protein
MQTLCGKRMAGTVAVTAPGIVPEIVPASCQIRSSGANSSQVSKLRKLLKRQDLREKTKMAEKPIDV